VTYQTPGQVHLYSGITKQWTTVNVAGPDSVFQANDYVVIKDGTALHAFASHRGTVETITTSGGPIIVSGPSSSSWVTLVADGTQAWGFGAFRGVWEPLTLTQPNPTMVSTRLIGLLKDGSTVYGFNAHYGTFVPVAADLAATLNVVGEAEVGTAHSPTVFRAFSAQQNTWGVQNVASTANALQQNEFAMVTNGNTVTAFSGISGTFASYTATTSIGTIANQEGVAAFFDGTDAVAYAVGPGAFSKRPAAPGSQFVLDYHFAMLVEPNAVTPFSSVLGGFGPTLTGSYSIFTNDEVGFADGPTADYGYSPILNAWTQAPPVTALSSAVLVRSAAVIPTNTGYIAFSSRHGTWVPLASSLTGNFLAPTTGATFVAFDNGGTTASVFDARLNRWATIDGQGPLTAKISRHTLVANDGVFGYGFSQPTGEWDVVPINNGLVSMEVSSSVATIKSGTDFSVYSAQGSFSYTGRYPEFTQAINLGNTLKLHQVAPAGSALILLVGVNPARIDLGLLLGKLYIDPNFLLTYPLAQTVGPSGLLDIAIPLPQSPTLVGLRPQLQNVVLPPFGATPWLSTSVAPVLF
jgi:hypothetical protein